jgi:hypothetical protein
MVRFCLLELPLLFYALEWLCFFVFFLVSCCGRRYVHNIFLGFVGRVGFLVLLVSGLAGWLCRLWQAVEFSFVFVFFCVSSQKSLVCDINLEAEG